MSIEPYESEQIIPTMTEEVKETIIKVKGILRDLALTTFHKYREAGQVILEAGYERTWHSEIQKWALKEWAISPRTFNYIVQLGRMEELEFRNVIAQFRSLYSWTQRTNKPKLLEIKPIERFNDIIELAQEAEKNAEQAIEESLRIQRIAGRMSARLQHLKNIEETLTDLEITTNQAWGWMLLADIPEKEFNEYLETERGREYLQQIVEEAPQ